MNVKTYRYGRRLPRYRVSLDTLLRRSDVQDFERMHDFARARSPRRSFGKAGNTPAALARAVLLKV